MQTNGLGPVRVCRKFCLPPALITDPNARLITTFAVIFFHPFFSLLYFLAYSFFLSVFFLFLFLFIDDIGIDTLFGVVST